MACNILNQTVNLLQTNPEEENVNTPDRKSNSSTHITRGYGIWSTKNTGQRQPVQNTVNILPTHPVTQW